MTIDILDEVCGCPINAYHRATFKCPRVIVTQGKWKGRVGVIVDGSGGRPDIVKPYWIVRLDARGRAKVRDVKVSAIDDVEVDPQVVDPLVPGTPEWARVITASKVAAILGLSPYDSPLSCWHKMKGNIPLEQETEDHRRGHYAEPAIIAWWRDEHPEFTDVLRHPQYRSGWAAATPDALASGRGVGEALVEAKTARSLDDWGEPGTDEVPAYYLVQALFQMWVSGIERVYMPVWGSWFEMAEYVIDYDDELARGIADKCEAFYLSLEADTPPPLDDTLATFQCLKALHPEIDKGVVADLDLDTAVEFVEAAIAFDAAKARKQGAQSAVLNVMGRAQYAAHEGVRVARRQPSNGDSVAIFKVAKTTEQIIGASHEHDTIV